MSLTKQQRKTTLLRLIKAYLLFRPNSTSKDIRNWLSIHPFGLNVEFTPHQIGKIIRSESSNPALRWFNVEGIRDMNATGIRWRVIEDEYSPFSGDDI